LRDAAGLRAMARQVAEGPRPLVVVVSALARTTSRLEGLAARVARHEPWLPEMEALARYHREVLAGLGKVPEQVEQRLEKLLGQLSALLKAGKAEALPAWTDRVVAYGELLSAAVAGAYLRALTPEVQEVDIRNVLVTDNHFGAAAVDIDTSRKRAEKAFDGNHPLYLTQGFIAATADGTPTTLGREGSDYTAALLGSFLQAEKVVLWKDVPGVMNADPAIDPQARHLPAISYQEAAEMAFYGAKVIHPNTIKPLQNQHIPLEVRGLFHDPGQRTVIWDFEEMERRMPVFIRKERQILLSVFPRDYSFVLNTHLVRLSELFREWGFRIGLIQISAISVSYCIDDPGERLMERVKRLQEEYEVYFNRGVELLTFRHYRPETVEEKLENLLVLLEQRTRLTVQYVVKRP